MEGTQGEDVNPGLSHQGAEEQDPLRPWHHHHLPNRLVHSNAGCRLQGRERLRGEYDQQCGELHRTGEPVLGRCNAAAVHLRIGRHAVHHRIDRGAAAARRDPALPYHRSRRAAVHDNPRHRAFRRAVQLPVQQCDPRRLHLEHGRHDHGDDRRHRPDHVDGRIDHREGHRPGHVDPHLPVHLLGLPAAAVADRLGHERHRSSPRRSSRS